MRRRRVSWFIPTSADERREQEEEVYGEREEAREEVNRKARVGNRREKRERESKTVRVDAMKVREE